MASLHTSTSRRSRAASWFCDRCCMVPSSATPHNMTPPLALAKAPSSSARASPRWGLVGVLPLNSICLNSQRLSSPRRSCRRMWLSGILMLGSSQANPFPRPEQYMWRHRDANYGTASSSKAPRLGLGTPQLKALAKCHRPGIRVPY